jgi:hypothetical protein
MVLAASPLIPTDFPENEKKIAMTSFMATSTIQDFINEKCRDIYIMLPTSGAFIFLMDTMNIIRQLDEKTRPEHLAYGPGFNKRFRPYFIKYRSLVEDYIRYMFDVPENKFVFVWTYPHVDDTRDVPYHKELIPRDDIKTYLSIEFRFNITQQIPNSNQMDDFILLSMATYFKAMSEQKTPQFGASTTTSKKKKKQIKNQALSILKNIKNTQDNDEIIRHLSQNLDILSEMKRTDMTVRIVTHDNFKEWNTTVLPPIERIRSAAFYQWKDTISTSRITR